MRKTLLQFFIGLAMLCVGGYWFLSSVSVHTGFYSIRFGGAEVGGGLVIVPFLAGVIWLFINHKSFGAKLVTALGAVIIVASLIAGTTFMFRSTTLYAYLVMLVLMLGGAVLLLRVLFSTKKKEDDEI